MKSNLVSYRIEKMHQHKKKITPITNLLQSLLQLGASFLFVDELLLQVFGQLDVLPLFDLVIVGRILDF